MASRSERRAALSHRTSGSSDSKAAEAPAGNPADAGANPAPTTTEDPEEPMKILFDSVLLDRPVSRFGDKGFASSTTTHFRASEGVTIEFDPASQLLRLAKGALVIHIHASKIDRFGDTVEGVELQAKVAAAARRQAAAEAAESAANDAKAALAALDA